MKSIKEVETLVGISAQNIRYYEKEGLIQPSRNHSNSYREYNDEDIKRLQTIKMFRKIGMPIEEIKDILFERISLQDGLERHQKRLLSEKEQITVSLNFCKNITVTKLCDLNIEECLHKMNEEEKNGASFSSLLEDYKKVIHSEMICDFTYTPDTRCDTPQEFTDSLAQYAKENNLNISFIRESMCPQFFLNGIEYKAYRTSGRFGINIHCEVLHPENYIPEGMSKKRYQWMRICSILALPLLFFIICNIPVFTQLSFQNPEDWYALIVLAILFIANLSWIFYSFGKNYNG